MSNGETPYSSHRPKNICYIVCSHYSFKFVGTFLILSKTKSLKRHDTVRFYSSRPRQQLQVDSSLPLTRWTMRKPLTGVAKNCLYDISVLTQWFNIFGDRAQQNQKSGSIPVNVSLLSSYFLKNIYKTEKFSWFPQVVCYLATLKHFFQITNINQLRFLVYQFYHLETEAHNS